MTRILLVEDEPVIAAGVRDDLELEGYQVDHAADGRSAASRIASEKYDLILLDVMLPGKDGYTICREARAAGITTPIIMLTARGQEVDKVLGLELGADDYVTKPFGRLELLARVKAALRRGAPAANLLEFGDVKVDFTRCEAWRAGERLELTAKEMAMLQTFAVNQGKALTLDEIVHSAWGEDEFITDRVIYTHMNNLRNKLEPDPHEPRHFITVRGVGYRFDI